MSVRAEERPWGSFVVHEESRTHWVKTITVHSGEATSLQSHQHRHELWAVVAGAGWFFENGRKTEVAIGATAEIPPGTIHRMQAAPDSSLVVVEVALGSPSEDDIERYQDRYGRS